MTPTALAAGAEAARAQAGKTLDAGRTGGASSSTTRGDFDPDQFMNKVIKMMKDNAKPTGGPPMPKKQARVQKRKAAAKQKGAGAAAGGDPNKSKSLIGKIHLAAMKGGKCIRFNKGTCTNKKCDWEHRCCFCDKDGCAGHKHTDGGA